ncbi:uncharacterized protein LOC9655581 [Selaginella moellendorffii]|uniref:uncharacterized protein LOC9655581 n=1 Tax=Selaginella moellendorffii TaxID=88036 RepID=UPI000D1C9BCF|nr:uncharacterized protein LOC9655581 [Selaginella moellendorffii]|eukprot:XP_002963991.2 uncharacterized protein LOC9655581 [Selaginella moellendorffii]
METENKDQRTLLWGASLLLFFLLMLLTPAITKNQSQHAFADQRNFLGFPNTLNVFSTFPYLVIGCIGTVLCAQGNYFGFSSQGEVWGWTWFFVGITASAFGSAYYHLRPSDSRFVWDCLPMAYAFASIVAVFVVEKRDELKGPKSFVPLLLAASATATYWWFADDMQLFALLQFIPSVAIPAMTVALPPKYTQSWYWMWAAGMYLLAKLAEAFDSRVYHWTRFLVSGHTVKHLSTAMVPVFLMIMLAPPNVKIERLTV